MHVTLLGASRFGVATARQLIDAGHEVVLIDKNRDRLDDLADGLDCAMICGDGSLPETLQDAYGDGSDALVTLTNEDDVNILAAVVGRSIGYDRVIPQIVRPQLVSVADQLDLSDVITPHESLARSIVSGLIDHSEVETELTLHRELRIVNHAVPKGLDGTTIGDLDLPKDARVVAQSGTEEERFADKRIKLKKGDHLILVVAHDAIEDVKKLFDPD